MQVLDAGPHVVAPAGLVRQRQVFPEAEDVLRASAGPVRVRRDIEATEPDARRPGRGAVARVPMVRPPGETALIETEFRVPDLGLADDPVADDLRELAEHFAAGFVRETGRRRMDSIDGAERVVVESIEYIAHE